MKKKGYLSLLAVLLGLIFGALLMVVIGKNPIEAYTALLQGAFSSIENLGNTLAKASPLILTGLAVAFAFRTGLFNIGAAGQMLFGAFCATAAGLTLNLPAGLQILAVIFAGIIGGALWAFIPGLLKAKFNVNEVVSTIMMNWIAYWTVYYMVPKHFKGAMDTESQKLPEASTLKAEWLTNMFDGSYINFGLVLAIIAVIVVAFILNKTVLGYELKAVGFNRDGAEYAGISVNKSIIISMMISGALAGLAGVAAYTGNADVMQIGVMPTEGFDGIAVALLGANTPIGALVSGIFFGVLYTGKGFMSVMADVPPEITDTIMAVIIYFAATSVLIGNVVDKVKKRNQNKKLMLPVDGAKNSEGKVS